MDNPLIGAKIVEASGHISSEIDWHNIKKGSIVPRKNVWHFSELTLEMPDGTKATLEASSYYDASFMELT